MRQHLMSERYYSRYYSLEQHIKPADRHHHHDGGAIVPTNATDTCLYNVPSPILQFPVGTHPYHTFVFKVACSYVSNAYDSRLCQNCRLQNEPLRSAFRGWEGTTAAAPPPPPDPYSAFHQQSAGVEFNKSTTLPQPSLPAKFSDSIKTEPNPNKNAELNVQCFEYNGEIYAKEIWKQKERAGRWVKSSSLALMANRLTRDILCFETPTQLWNVHFDHTRNPQSSGQRCLLYFFFFPLFYRAHRGV